jgi:Cu-Zn family superoxide dismutase
MQENEPQELALPGFARTLAALGIGFALGIALAVLRFGDDSGEEGAATPGAAPPVASIDGSEDVDPGGAVERPERGAGHAEQAPRVPAPGGDALSVEEKGQVAGAARNGDGSAAGGALQGAAPAEPGIGAAGARLAAEAPAATMDVVLEPAPAATARGEVQLYVEAGDLRIVARVLGVQPGEHALVLHDGAACFDARGQPVLGGHFNPFEMPHGTPNTAGAHLGDFGNVVVGRDGKGEQVIVLEQAYYPVRRISGWQSLLGKPLALHAARDDFMTQPDGGVGPVLACGLIHAAD